MGFDADAHLAARRTWELTIAGRSFVARPISVEQVYAFEILSHGLPRALYWAAFLKLLRLAFPKRLSFWWRGDPVTLFAALPDDAKERARESFFPYLAGVPAHVPSDLATAGTS